MMTYDNYVIIMYRLSSKHHNLLKTYGNNIC